MHLKARKKHPKYELVSDSTEAKPTATHLSELHINQEHPCNDSVVGKKRADLDEPDDIVGVELVLDNPRGQDVPLDALATVDGDAILGVLVLARLQVAQHLLCQLRQEAPVQQVVLWKKERGTHGQETPIAGTGGSVAYDVKAADGCNSNLQCNVKEKPLMWKIAEDG